MDEGSSRRVVSSDRIELIKAYEAETTFRGRALAAEALWQSLAVTYRLELRRTGDHCGRWLQEALGPSDEKTGWPPPMTASGRGQLKMILNKEQRTKNRPGKNMSLVWKWLDERVIAPETVKTLLQRAERLHACAPATPWESHLAEALNFSKQPRAQKASKRPVDVKATAAAAKKVAVEKTLQFKQLRRILKSAPSPADLPIPNGVDAHSYREAYAEMLENVRVVLDVAGRDFHNAKRRYRTTEIAGKVGVFAKSCRLLRIPVPSAGQPADEMTARRRWLEIVKVAHPDTSGGDTSKVELFTEANRAFDAIKEHNRLLRAAAKSEEAK